MSKFAVAYSTEHFSDTFYLDDPAAAVSTAIDILMAWAMDARSGWDPDAVAPTEDQRDAWNHMIGTSTVFVYEVVPGHDGPEEEDVIWDMEDDVLHAIGWEDL